MSYQEVYQMAQNGQITQQEWVDYCLDILEDLTGMGDM